jgi:hypothetical protein
MSSFSMIGPWSLISYGGIFIYLIYFVILVLGVYALILLIQLLKRGIRALDIYIHEKTSRNPY